MKPNTVAVLEGLENSERAAGESIRNMSAPPRTSLRIRPYHAKTADAEVRENWDAAGLSLRGQMSRDHVLRRHVPECLASRKKVPWGGKNILAGLVILSWIAHGEPSEQVRPALRSLMRRTMESLRDEYLEKVSMIQSVALGLPAFGFVRTESHCLEPEEDVGRMLALFSRTSGGIFIGSRAPVIPECHVNFNPCYLLYVPC